MKRIKGFTLLEMMVVVTLTGILLGLGYVFWNLIKNDFNQLHESYRDEAGVRTLYQIMQADMENYPVILCSAEENGALDFRNNFNDIRYHLDDGHLFRGKDTLMHGIDSLIPYHKAERIPQGRCDALEIIFKKGGSLFIFQNKRTENLYNDPYYGDPHR